MPTAGTQTTRVIHCVPVVQAAVISQVRGIVAVNGLSAKVGVVSIFPLTIAQIPWNRIAVGVMLRAKVLREPALVADRHQVVRVAVENYIK